MRFWLIIAVTCLGTWGSLGSAVAYGDGADLTFNSVPGQGSSLGQGAAIDAALPATNDLNRAQPDDPQPADNTQSEEGSVHRHSGAPPSLADWTPAIVTAQANATSLVCANQELRNPAHSAPGASSSCSLQASHVRLQV